VCRIFYHPVCYPKNLNIKIYRIIILSFVLCGREISLTLREKLKLDGVLKRIFAARREEVTGEWRKLHNELTQYF